MSTIEPAGQQLSAEAKPDPLDESLRLAVEAARYATAVHLQAFRDAGLLPASFEEQPQPLNTSDLPVVAQL
jgi:hypothetical protein